MVHVQLELGSEGDRACREGCSHHLGLCGLPSQGLCNLVQLAGETSHSQSLVFIICCYFIPVLPSYSLTQETFPSSEGYFMI